MPLFPTLDYKMAARWLSQSQGWKFSNGPITGLDWMLPTCSLKVWASSLELKFMFGQVRI